MSNGKDEVETGFDNEGAAHRKEEFGSTLPNDVIRCLQIIAANTNRLVVLAEETAASRVKNDVVLNEFAAMAKGALASFNFPTSSTPS